MVFNIASTARIWLLAMMIKAENTVGLDSFEIIYFLSSIFKIVFNVAPAACMWLLAMIIIFIDMIKYYVNTIGNIPLMLKICRF